MVSPESAERFFSTHITTPAMVTLLQEAGVHTGVTVKPIKTVLPRNVASLIQRVEISGQGDPMPFWTEVARRTRIVLAKRDGKV